MSEEEIIEIFNNLKEYIQDKINNGDHKIFYNDLGWDVKCVDCITAMDTLLELYNKQKEEIKELKHNLKNYSELYYLECEKYENSISKDTIRDMQIQREFELQQEYEDFEDDIEWQTYKKLLED